MADDKRIGAEDLGIRLGPRSDGELFRWLVACLLFGARISQDIAARAFHVLDEDGVLTPQGLRDANWAHLVRLLGEGGYRRYDESTARELIALGKDTMDRYDGRLSRLPKSDSSGSLSKTAVGRRLQEFTGIGPTSARIFLRDAGPVWKL